MSGLAEKLIEQVLCLPVEERAEVAERVLSSLEPKLSEVDQTWARETEDRIDAFDRGEIPGIPAEDVFNEIKNRKQ